MKDVRYNRYMRVWEGIRKFAHYPGVPVIGGMLLGALVAGIIVLIMIYWLQPMLTPETRGLARYQSGNVVVWYPKDLSATAGFDPAVLATTLNGDLSRLVAFLHVNPTSIPQPIDVFIHPTLREMQNSIALRKGGTSRVTYAAPLDLLVGENPRFRLAELVLAFGWGRCNSLLLKTGMRLYAAQPNRNFYGGVAALPDRLFLSISQLIHLEDEGYFPSTVYDQFDSPYSPAEITTMTAFRNLIDLTPGGGMNSIPVLEAAALVQYLISRCKGVDAIRQIWGPGLTERLLTQLTGESVVNLSADWRSAVKEQGISAPDYERWHIYYLLASGAPDSAYTDAMAWYKAGKAMSDNDRMLVAQCALTVGDIGTASMISRHASEKVQSSLGRYITLYTGWETANSSKVRVIGVDANVAQTGLTRIEAIYDSVTKKLALTRDMLPQRLTVFLYPDAASLADGEKLTPFPANQCAILHLLEAGDIAAQVAEVLLAYGWNALTYSATLRIGVTTALTQPEQALIARGCQLKSNKRWVQLKLVDAGAVDIGVVQTEAGLMIDYLLHKFGPEALHRLWVLTSPVDSYLALDTAIAQVYGLTRSQIEKAIMQSFLECS